MDRTKFITSKHKRRAVERGCRVKARPGLKPFYYWHDDLKGIATRNVTIPGQIYVKWDGYDVLSLCEEGWLLRE